jgi:hypothetical protein
VPETPSTPFAGRVAECDRNRAFSDTYRREGPDLPAIAGLSRGAEQSDLPNKDTHMTSIEDIDLEAASLAAALRAARDKHALAAFTARGGDAKANAAATKAESEVASIEQALANLTAARRAAVAQRADAEHASRVSALEQARADIDIGLNAKIKAYAKVEAAVKLLEAALTEAACAGASARAAVHAAAAIARQDAFSSVAIADMAGGAPNAVTQALADMTQRLFALNYPLSHQLTFPFIGGAVGSPTAQAKDEQRRVLQNTAHWAVAEPVSDFAVVTEAVVAGQGLQDMRAVPLTKDRA